MAKKKVTRKLAAILATDMVGFSRLMEKDEAGTVARQKAHRKRLIDPKIAKHNGRIVKSTGDGLLVEFASAVDAVQCAVEVQRAMSKLEADVPKERRIAYRVGINVGDIIVEDDDIFGDGVNIAARLQILAEPGGICVSRNVFNQVKNKVELGFADLGPQKVKNIEEPVPTYKVLLDPAAAGEVVPAKRISSPVRRWATGAVAAALLIAVAGLLWWQPWRPTVERASIAKMAHPLPKKPSIAVLPFTNMSGDKEQEYFADGITEDIITDLSKISGLFVIARNSTFTYKGKSVKVRQVAQELGVRYVLEGSVRRAGQRVRINAQLIDATTGGHLWAERYDGPLADVFALQDKVTKRIVAALAVQLTSKERAIWARVETRIPAARDAFLRGWAYYRRNTPDDFVRAVPHLKRAVALDPNYNRANAALAAVYWGSFARDFTSRGGVWIERLGLTQERAIQEAQKYLTRALRQPGPLAHRVASGLYSFQGRHEAAIAAAQNAVALDVNDPIGHEALAAAWIYRGQPKRGIDAIRQAMRLDPHYPPEYLVWLGLAQFGMERFDDAIVSLNKAVQRNPSDDLGLILLAAAYGQTGRKQQAVSTIAKLNGLRAERRRRFAEARTKGVKIGLGNFLVGPYTLKDVDLWPYKKRVDRERLRAALKKAGVPEIAKASAESPVKIAGTSTVDATAAKALFDRGVKFVDVRTRSHWNLGHVPRAVLLDFSKGFNATNLLANVRKDQEVVFYCMGPKCLLSSKACTKAVSWGFTKIYYFRGGFPSWKAAGYPVGLP